VTVEWIRGTLGQVREDLATRARTNGGPKSLGEKRDLEPSLIAALTALFPERVAKDRTTAIPEWASVGGVDVTVASAANSSSFEAAFELKWSKLDEGLWDLFKLALLSTRRDRPACYLLTGASKAAWSTGVGGGLFADAVHDPRRLCQLRYSTGKRRLVWDWMLEGGYDHHPERVPERIRTTLEGAATIDEHGQLWEIRLARVAADTGSFVEFPGGWPDGNRPADATHPLGAGPADR
jgi:hypothetical protein